ncbi:MAG: IS1595 family transposase [Chthoniobacteraceae bacterium]|jgi:transposase-like protein
MKNEFPETLRETVEYFSNDENAFQFVRAMRWPGGVAVCPKCECKESYILPARKMWKCKKCAKQYSVRVGTIFEDSPISLGTWMCAFWLIVNAKNGISSYEIARGLGVTQKTAWFMLHRVRLAIQNGSIVKMGGTVEVDETFIGGKARNMHKGKRQVKGTGPVAMTPVQGLLERKTAKRASRVILKVAANRRKHEMQGNVRQYVLKGSEVHTDALLSYEGLNEDYTHQVIDHAEAYVNGHVHTNGLENFWSLLKRTIKGTYVSVEPFHLFRYLDEQAFRFNERKDDDQGRFLKAIAGIVGRRLTYAGLTGAEEGLHPAGAW